MPILLRTLLYVQVNQIELHPWQRKEDIVEYCRKNGIAVMGYSPLTKGNFSRYFTELVFRHAITAMDSHSIRATFGGP